MASTTGSIGVDRLVPANRVYNWPLFTALVVVVAFIPIIFFRYAYHDSWAWLMYFSQLRTYDLPNLCVAIGGNHELMGKPLMTSLLCALTAFGAVVDRIWIPRLIAFAMLMGAGALLLSVFRQARVNMAVASLALLSLMLLPGTVLMISWMATNPIACAAFAAVLAGWLWLRYLRHPRHGFAIRFALSLLVLFLLVLSLFTYQVVALFFFVPLMVELLFTKQESNWRQFMFPVLAVATFGVASICYVIGHKILLYDFHYFFLTEQQVSGVNANNRNVAFLSVAEIRPKLDFLVSVLLPRVLSLWFVSAETAFVPEAAIFFGALTVVALIVFAIQAKNIWRVFALTLIVACFFVPFLASANQGNGLYTNERVKMFMQLPFVLLVWWLINLLVTARGGAPTKALAITLSGAVLVGTVVCWFTVLRVRVIPSYLELKHVEVRLREVVRHGTREIYVIKAEDRHLRAALGNRASDEFGRITSFYFPQHMIMAMLIAIDPKKGPRPIIDVEAKDGDSIKPAPNRYILDMRKFP